MRTRLLSLLVPVCLAAGCGDDVVYELSWQFMGDTEIATAGRCGAHGVESFMVSEVSSAGDGIRNQVLCSLGTVHRKVPEGQWQVSLLGLDTRTRPTAPAVEMNLTGAAGPFTVSADGERVRVTVIVQPRPQCADGIDNDSDGAVDGDDSGCQTGAQE